MTAVLATVEKTSVDVIDYDVDFGRWLTPDDIIQTAIAAVEDPTVTFAVDHVDISSLVAKVWVKLGADGEESEIATTITTQDGRTKRVCFKLRIRDC